MNKLARELEDKANSLLRKSSDLDLTEAAIYMHKAAQCIKSYEVKYRKQEYVSEPEK